LRKGGLVVDAELIAETAKALYVRALKVLPPDVKTALARAHARETHPRAREILATMLKNVEVAEARNLLVCQDTGTPVFRVRVGRRFPFDALGGRGTEAALAEGVRRATVEHPLRSSVCHPLTRENPQTNTGWRIPVVDWEFLPDGDMLELRMMPKGSGSENMTFLRMLPPAAGLAGVKRFVIECVVEAGGKPCPPVVLGVGLGGTADLCVKLAKEAIWRPIGEPHPEPDLAKLEVDLLEAVNLTGLGPMGLGGDTTALGVMIEAAYTHITQNPVAVTLQCWRGERASARIFSDGRFEHGF
jgi:tartrate/fumarate subfamily iron-sulfur-dependent hydro-lyase alpha chain